MADYKVAEIFTSVNGEGRRSGQLALFIRMSGCNLKCEYCDTEWAGGEGKDFRMMSTEEIMDEVRRSGARNVTLTGGEPLLQKEIEELLAALTADPWLRIEIETNGSIALRPLLRKITDIRGVDPDSEKPSRADAPDNLSFNMDYKLPGSGMEHRMRPANFDVLGPGDTVKFVVRDRTDLVLSLELIADHRLTERCRVFLSPVYGEIEPEEIVKFMKEHHMNDVTLQLQIHKIIWDSGRSGV